MTDKKFLYFIICRDGEQVLSPANEDACSGGGGLHEDGTVRNAIQFSIENMDVLECISLRKRNPFEFFCLYIEKTLKDSGLWGSFETFFELQTKASLQELKTGFSDFCIKYTPINKRGF